MTPSLREPRIRPPLKPSVLSEQEKLIWLRLARSEFIGPKTFFDLLRCFGTVEAALDAVPLVASRGGKRRIQLCSLDQAKKELEAVARLGAKLVAYCEPGYPARLRHIDDPPPIITVLGNTQVLAKDGIAMVGARNASAAGCRFATILAQELGQAGYVIVSGMARGIDTAVHRGSLASGTVAVLAGGIDSIYPPENEPLYRAIEKQGAIIAELPQGAAPKAVHFPQRNRIISGMSLGVIVIEAALKSGSLITARLALEQGREVFAVPGHPQDPRAQGPNKLLKQGATFVESAQDVIDALQATPLSPRSNLFEDAKQFEPPRIKPPTENELDAVRRKVLEKLGPVPVHVDVLAVECEVPISFVIAILLELELNGKLERHRGNKVSLIYE